MQFGLVSFFMYFCIMKSKENKSGRGLSPELKPDGMDITAWQRALRRQAAVKGAFSVQALSSYWSPGVFSVAGSRGRRNYTTIFHGTDSDWNSCDCMDFRTSGLGTCKHLEAVKLWLEKERRRPDANLPAHGLLDIDYSDGRRLRFRPTGLKSKELAMAGMRYFDDDGYAVAGMVAELPAFIEQARRIDPCFHCTSDALNFVLEERDRLRRIEAEASLTDVEIGSALATRLYPFQIEGIRFAFRAGRALIADDMGLGKTIQAIGTAELLKARNMAGEVLVICPTSLKYQWKKEIERFTDSDITVIEGPFSSRRELYGAPTFYKIVSYHTLANDIKALGGLSVDMLIMDEVQRLKNWNTQISQAARRIDSEYAVVLSGTPLENKIEELYSVMQFVDQYALGPLHKFVSDTVHRSETGKVSGYRNLNRVGEKLRGHMLRRRKADVALQMPERIDKTLFVPMTREQRAIHDDAMSAVAQLVHRWRKMRFLSEKDRKRLLLLLSRMRMVCDSTYVLDQKTRNDTKIAETMQLIEAAIENGSGDKVVVFSQWERMTRLLAQELDAAGIGYVYLHGAVPASKRGDICASFTSDPAVRVFISTDAGSTGLNLQVASLIINLDLPWNPAVLEQRIARIYRLGQTKHVQVINLVSAGTIEERMLSTLNFKSNLASGVLDGGDDSITLDDSRLTRLADTLAEVLDKDSADTATLIASDNDTEGGPADAPVEASLPDIPEPSEIIGAASGLLNGLARTLQSEEATARLVDALVHTEADGSTSIRIPVGSRDAVVCLLSAFSKLLQK